MFLRLFFVSLFTLINTSLWAFTCIYTLAKDSCWTEYNVTVDVIDELTSKTLLTVTAPKGKPWARGTFNCEPAQGLRYVAQFSPVFWENDAGKTYPGLRNWYLPAKINPGDLAWTIPICYPSDFAQVPFPPKAGGNCQCDFDSIPAPKL
ncbi:hypothetical protein EP47_06710 [Legionella norrlandica]|uniref:Periplasmic protein n=1 Tax=Legionella norrlandica TaxID=1498499 RepID=A0A0A2STW3_9GAMM|nr:hypothetical protein [Legionella norrlandica]KGP63166.1 hypothetical protein EP47_06710 [Legionella norrlandica]